ARSERSCSRSVLRSFPPRRSSDLEGEHLDGADAGESCDADEAEVIAIEPAGGGAEHGAGAADGLLDPFFGAGDFAFGASEIDVRSEEHTSELQSRVDLLCRLLLEK